MISVAARPTILGVIFGERRAPITSELERICPPPAGPQCRRHASCPQCRSRASSTGASRAAGGLPSAQLWLQLCCSVPLSSKIRASCKDFSRETFKYFIFRVLCPPLAGVSAKRTGVDSLVSILVAALLLRDLRGLCGSMFTSRGHREFSRHTIADDLTKSIREVDPSRSRITDATHVLEAVLPDPSRWSAAELANYYALFSVR